MNNIDEASYTAAVNQIGNLQYISKERIKNELLKLLGAPYGKEVYENWFRTRKCDLLIELVLGLDF